MSADRGRFSSLDIHHDAALRWGSSRMIFNLEGNQILSQSCDYTSNTLSCVNIHGKLCRLKTHVNQCFEWNNSQFLVQFGLFHFVTCPPSIAWNYLCLCLAPTSPSPRFFLDFYVTVTNTVTVRLVWLKYRWTYEFWNVTVFGMFKQ